MIYLYFSQKIYIFALERMVLHPDVIMIIFWLSKELEERVQECITPPVLYLNYLFN